MQILHRQSPARIPVAGRYDPVLRIDLRKNNLPHIRPRGPQRALAQLLRQVIQKPVDDPEDLLGCLLRVRYFQRQRPRLGNRLQEKPCRRPGRQPHLPCLQHDIPAAPQLFEGLLRRIRPQRRRPPLPRPHPQQLFGQRHPHGPPPQAHRALIQNLPKPRQLLRVQFPRAQAPISTHGRAFFCCFRHKSPVSTGESYCRCWAKRNLLHGAVILNISACEKQL